MTTRGIAVPVGLVLAGLATWLFLVAASPKPLYAGKPLRHWLLQLNATDYRQRNQAEAALATIGPEALPELIAALQLRESWLLRRVDRLAPPLLAPSEYHVPPRLIQQQAAALVGTLGDAGAAASTTLLGLLASPSPDLAREAETALRKIGLAALPALTNGVAATDPIIRCRTAALLGNAETLAPQAGTAVLQLRIAIRDPVPAVARQAARSIVAYPQLASTFLGDLAALLESPSDDLRATAAGSLAILGTNAAAVLPLLREKIADPAGSVRLEIARAVWRVSGEARLILPVLVKALAEPDWRWQAALILRELGEAGEPAIPGLLKALQEEPVVRPSRTPAGSALALARMGPKAVPGLTALLADPRPSVRVGAAVALAGHGPGAAPAAPALRAMLSEADPEARIVAITALGAIGREARDALPDLRNLMQDHEDYVRSAAWRTLEQLDPQY